MSETPEGMTVNTAEQVSAREARRLEIERTFRPKNMTVVRKELFANLRDPAVTIRDGNITFNTACINGLEQAIYVNLMVDQDQGLLAVHACGENDRDALRWCVAKPDKRKSRKMTCPGFTDLLYKTMGWEKIYRYKSLGYRIMVKGESYYVFDLKVKKVFRERPKKGQRSENAVSVPVDRKGYYPEDIANTFGVSVEQYQLDTNRTEMDGFTPAGLYTDVKKAEQ